jgi:hypothetical protein
VEEEIVLIELTPEKYQEAEESSEEESKPVAVKVINAEEEVLETKSKQLELE